MKRILFFAIYAVLKTALAQQIYLNLNSHNEVSNEPYDVNLNYFNLKYAKIKELADSVNSKQVKWNFQSDIRFLMGELNYDPKSSATNGDYLLKWMDDSPYIECDPHSHEQLYLGLEWNYADVAHYHDSLGVTNRKNVGGFKYDGLQNGSNWEEFENGMQAKQANYTWYPDVLWGGSSSFGGVHNDLDTYGAWYPTSMSDFFTNDPSKRVRMLGNGCKNVVFDTTDVSTAVDRVKYLVDLIDSGQIPSNEFYTATIQINCRDIDKVGFVQKVCTVLDSMNALADRGKITWATIGEKDSIWRNTLASQPYRRDCDGLLTRVETSQKTSVYPNPTSDRLHIEGIYADWGIYNLAGQKVQDGKAEELHNISLKSYPEGIYLLLFSTGESLKIQKTE